MRIRTLRVSTRATSYPVWVGEGALGRASELLHDLSGSHFAVVTNPTVADLHLPELRASLSRIGTVSVHVVPDGERHKTLSNVERLLGALVRERVDRKGVLVALGGGVVTDMAGFAAAMYLRGIRLVMAPTTLVGQVDAAVGGKVGVNLIAGKNLAGAFHQPVGVIADTGTLATLPLRHMRAAMAEVIKYGLIGDIKLLGYMKKMTENGAAGEVDLDLIVESSVQDKARVVAADEREMGQRRVLNLGHTLGHALEAATHYKRYLHGEAVALGILFAGIVAHHVRRLSTESLDQIEALLRGSGIPLVLPRLPARRVLSFFRTDKKQEGGTLHFVLPVGMARVAVTKDVPPHVFGLAYRDLALRLKGTMRRGA